MTQERYDFIAQLYDKLSISTPVTYDFVPVTSEEVAEFIPETGSGFALQMWQMIDQFQQYKARKLREELIRRFGSDAFYADDNEHDTQLLRQYHMVESCGVTPKGKLYTIL